MRCNRALKFGALLERARQSGVSFDYIATGHYAQVEYDPAQGRHILRRALDRRKDQSYFLAQLRQEQLRQLALPLGGMTKEQVKALACAKGWQALAEKPESQDFIESGDYSVLFEAHEAHPGPIVDTHGKVIGEHDGIIHYTIGQRRGLNVGGLAEPLYVIRLDAAANQVVAGTRQELFGSHMQAADLNWIAIPEAPPQPRPVLAKIRLRHQPAPATIIPHPQGRPRARGAGIRDSAKLDYPGPNGGLL